MTHKRISVELGRSWSAVRGRDAYPLLEAVGSRPVWSQISRAWMAQRCRGLDLIALAERRGYIVEVTHSVEPVPVITPPAVGPEVIEPEVDLFGEAI